MANLLDKLTDQVPAGRGINLLTATDIKQINQARGMGYSWDQIWKALDKYNSFQALAAAYYRVTGDTDK